MGLPPGPLQLGVDELGGAEHRDELVVVAVDVPDRDDAVDADEDIIPGGRFVLRRNAIVEPDRLQTNWLFWH